jgi:hypothetical protein
LLTPKSFVYLTFDPKSRRTITRTRYFEAI